MGKFRYLIGVASAIGILLPIESSAIQFEDVSTAAGMKHPVESWGVAWGDYDGDGYPDLWAGNHRQSPTLYKNSGNGTFTNITSQVWSANPNTDAHGPAWADFDGDGDLDLIEQTGGPKTVPNQMNQFYVNNGGSLEEKAVSLGLDFTEHRGRSSLWFDYDKDGQLDLALTGYPNGGTGAHPSAIFRQTSSGFQNVSTQVGFDCPGNSTFAALSDLNDDGTLDLICHGYTFPQRVYDISKKPYKDITGLVPKTPSVHDAVFADFNGDLKTDIFSVRIPNNRSNVVLKNNKQVQGVLFLHDDEYGFDFKHAGSLHIDITAAYLKLNEVYIGSAGSHPEKLGSGVLRFTVDLDSGDSDTHGLKAHQAGVDPGLYIGYDPGSGSWKVRLSANSQFQSMWGVFKARNTSTISNLQKHGFDPVGALKEPKLLIKNIKNGQFQKKQDAALNVPEACVSVTAGDFDNDMDMDLYLVCEHSPVNRPNILFENLGGAKFRKVANGGGAKGTALGAGKSVAMADYDVDGFLDLFVTNGHNGGSIPNGPDQLFHNAGNANHWIELDLKGTTSNTHGIGARVIATAGGVAQLREQGNGAHNFVQNDQRIHFGLAGNAVVDLRVEWPSGQVDQHNGIAANHLYRVTEGGDIEKVAVGGSGGGSSGCGKPALNLSEDKGIVIWKECSGGWSMRVLAGGSTTTFRYKGEIVSTQAFTSVEGFQLENSDILDTSDTKRIGYLFRTLRKGVDGADFRPSPGASACFRVPQMPSGTKIMVGKDRKIATPPFDLNTLNGC